MPDEFGMYFSVGTFIALIGTVVAVTRRFSHIEAKVDSEAELRQTMEAEMEDTSREVQRVERDTLNRTDILRHETSEIGQGIRERVHELEMASRDRMDKVAADIRESIERLGDRLEDRITKALARKD